MPHDLAGKVEDREAKQLGLNEEQRVENSTRSAIAIEERMNRLELIVGECHDDERVESIVGMEETLPGREMIEEEAFSLWGSVDATPCRRTADKGSGKVSDDGLASLDSTAYLDRRSHCEGALTEGVESRAQCFPVAQRLFHLGRRRGKSTARSLEELIIRRDDVLDLAGSLSLHQRNDVDEHRRDAQGHD